MRPLHAALCALVLSGCASNPTTPAATDAAPTDATGDATGDATSLDASTPDASGADARDDATSSDARSDAAPADATAPRSIWVTGYYAGWMEGHLPVTAVDFDALTAIVHFSIVPNADGTTFDTTSNGVTAAQTTRVVSAAHAAGKKALLCIGGAGTHAGFSAWMAPSRRAAFVAKIVEAMKAGDYDGVDLDMEPVSKADAADFIPFVRALRAAMTAVKPGLLLTAAVGWNDAVFGPIVDQFDQINLMTYDLSGAWDGWETWHNAPLHDGGRTFASTKAPMPSCEGEVAAATKGGAPKAKVGIGMVFYAYVWKGANGPNQPIAGVTVEANMAYHTMMDTLWSASAERWHAGVEAPYLSIGSGASGKFVSYDDPRSISAKIDWVRSKGLGGVIVWELGGGYRPTQPVGKRDVLLQAVKSAAFP